MEEKETATTQRRIPSLDGMRAVSIFIVIFSHASSSARFPETLFKQPQYFLKGRSGVTVFFVISGFLITTLLLREIKKSGTLDLKHFYLRRIFRIFPVYYTYILVVAFLMTLLRIHELSGSTYLSALTFTTYLWGGWSGHAWLLEHSWSLSIEEQFYLLWPPILFYFGPKIGGRLWIISLIVIAPFFRSFLMPVIFPACGDALAFGCLVAFFIFQRPELAKAFFSYRPTVGRLVAVGAFYFDVLGAMTFHISWGRPEYLAVQSIQPAAISYLIGSFTLCRSGWGYHFLNWDWMCWLGRLSYSIYLWQQLFLVPRFLPAWNTWAVQFPQNIGLAFVASVISYYLIEQPVLAFKNKYFQPTRYPLSLPKDSRT